MASIKHIQCPSCGSASTFKTSQGYYKCNYCQTSIIVDEEKKNEENSTSGFSSSNVKFGTAKTISPNIIKVILFSVLTLSIGMGLAVFTITSSVSSEPIDAVFSEWQKPSMNHYECFAGSKGPVIWLMSKQTRNKLDSVKFPLQIIDPSNHTVQKELLYLPQMTWKESFYDDKELANEYLQIGDLAWNASENQGLRAFDIYTFEEKENEKSLVQRFKELSSGIAKAEIIRYKKAFKITTNDGAEFMYYPDRNIIRTQQEDNLSYRFDTLTTTAIYISRQKNHALWLITKKIDLSQNELQINDDDLQETDPVTMKKIRFGDIINAKKISEKKFLRAQALTRHKGNLVLLYTETMAKKSPVTLLCINKEGKTIWELKDQTLYQLSESPFDNINCDYQTGGNLLILNLQGNLRGSLGIDLNTGKIAWQYSLE